MPLRRLPEARRLAASLELDGRPRIELVLAADERPPARLRGRPGEAGGRTLAGVFATLRLGAVTEEAVRSALERLWGGAEARTAAPLLRRDGSASFLVVDGGAEAEREPGAARIVGVWIDGVEVTADGT